MCAHIQATFQAVEAAEILHAKLAARGWTPSPHVVPTQQLLALRRGADGRVIESLHWGLIPSWAHDLKIGAKTFNALDAARLSSAASMSGRPWMGSACPMRSACRDARSSASPGSSRRGAHRRAANAQTMPLHDRMPVILGLQALDRWLDPATPHDELHGLLVPFADSMMIAPTSIGSKPKVHGDED
jgi:putative SOS response-associated peptidase YedK